MSDNIEDLYRDAGSVTVRDSNPGRDCRRLTGRVAVLTGAARGIGFATAIRLTAEGARVWITDRDEAALATAAQAAEQAGLPLQTRRMDAGDTEDVQTGIAAIVAAASGIDILVNNAGGSLHTPYRFGEVGDGDWQRVMDLNVMGAVRASRAAVGTLAARGHGRIINFGSKAGRFGSLFAGPSYSAAKGAVAALTRQLAMEYGPQGITVNCICPGVVMTERSRGLWESRRTQEERNKALQDIPLRRYAEAEDIAAVVAFLASDDAAFITGVTLDVNGGQAMA